MRPLDLLVALLASSAAGYQALPRHPRPLAQRRTSSIILGPRVRVVAVGKAARDDKWVAAAIEQYTTRLRGTLDLECEWVRDDEALLASVERSSNGRESVIVLDERGKMCSSVEFAERLFTGLEEGGSRMSFFIGGAEGLPPALKARRDRLLSLRCARAATSLRSTVILTLTSPVSVRSSLTFPHQVARMLLCEQIYRATEIRKGSGYHKD